MMMVSMLLTDAFVTQEPLTKVHDLNEIGLAKSFEGPKERRGVMR